MRAPGPSARSVGPDRLRLLCALTAALAATSIYAAYPAWKPDTFYAAGATINAPYSVACYIGAVTGSTSAKRNPRDGAMLWSILKTAAGNCGSAAVSSPGTIGKKAAQTLGVVDDPVLQQAEWK